MAIAPHLALIRAVPLPDPFHQRVRHDQHKMAGAAGFEPAHADTKNRCLTTWPRPNNATFTSRGHAHNSKRRLAQCLW